MQENDVTINGNAITGTLKYMGAGNAITDNWGPGYFMALQFGEFDDHATSIKVGLAPSESSGLVEIINDPDRNGVFKVTDKDVQNFKIVQTDDEEGIKIQLFNLSGLTFEPAPNNG